MEKIVSVAFGGISKVDDGNMVAVVFCYLPIVSHDVAFGAILKKWTAKYERGIIIKKERITWKTPSIQRNSSKA